MTHEKSKKEHWEDPKKTGLRWKGIFFVLGAIVFLIQGLLFLNDLITDYLLLALVGVYYLAFARKWVGKQGGESLRSAIFRLAISFIGVLIGVSLVVLILVCIQNSTNIPPPFFLAGTSAIIGSVLIVCSYALPDSLPN